MWSSSSKVSDSLCNTITTCTTCTAINRIAVSHTIVLLFGTPLYLVVGSTGDSTRVSGTPLSSQAADHVVTVVKT
jgi:hypothetical protein